MRCDAARAVVAAGLLVLAAACSGGAAAHTAAPPHRSASAAAIPAPIVMRGTLSATAANTVYEAAIVPAYSLALQVADTLAMHPRGAAAAVSDFSSRLTRALASFAAVTGFPPYAEGSFAAYRSSAREILAVLARPAAVVASVQSRRQAAVQLYALAGQIGMLGTSLNLVPATEQGGKH